jgi:hypothetical protein
MLPWLNAGLFVWGIATMMILLGQLLPKDIPGTVIRRRPFAGSMKWHERATIISNSW